jgi:hypothetical protein
MRLGLAIQAFIAEAVVEALQVGILRRLARLNELQANRLSSLQAANARPRSSGPLSTTIASCKATALAGYPVATIRTTSRQGRRKSGSGLGSTPSGTRTQLC